MSFYICIGRWLTKIHHDRLMARLRASAKAQRTYLMWLQILDTSDYNPEEMQSHNDEIARITRTVNHLEGLMKDLHLSDNFNMYI